MNNSTFTTFFAGKERTFRLTIPHLAQIESQADCGCMKLHTVIMGLDCRFEVIRTIIRLALIGGGESAEEADLIIKNELPNYAYATIYNIALTVFLMAMVGSVDDPVGKPEGVEEIATLV